MEFQTILTFFPVDIKLAFLTLCLQFRTEVPQLKYLWSIFYAQNVPERIDNIKMNSEGIHAERRGLVVQFKSRRIILQSSPEEYVFKNMNLRIQYVCG